MRLESLDFNLYVWQETLLPDFMLAFAFFTAISYAVLGKRLENQRAAITISVCFGTALSLGLVWWLQNRGLSVKNLGPISAGFIILVLALVIYQAIRRIGGNWAGAGLALGVCLLIASIMGESWAVDQQAISSIMTTALIVGIIALLLRSHNHAQLFLNPAAKPDISDLYRNRRISRSLQRNLKRLEQGNAPLDRQADEAGNVLLQIQRLLPAEGYLTERMAQLRAQAHRMRKGHLARLEETRDICRQLPAGKKKAASELLAQRYHQMAGLDIRLERLEKSVSDIELEIRELTRQAQNYARNYNHQAMLTCLKRAEKLQKHNTHIFKLITRTENKLSALARQTAREVTKNGK